jgi:hypothetical protein
VIHSIHFANNYIVLRSELATNPLSRMEGDGPGTDRGSGLGNRPDLTQFRLQPHFTAMVPARRNLEISLQFPRAFSRLAATLCIGLAACGQEPFLTNDELENLLRGATMSHVRNLGDDPRLTFGCDGELFSSGGIASGVGRYSIRENQYCILTGSGKDIGVCEKLFRDERGQLFDRLGEIRIRKCPPDRACPQLGQVC